MDKVFLRNASNVSLLKKKSKNSMRIISSSLNKYLIENNEFDKRCISEVANGKHELQKLLDDARRIIFTKEDLIHWFHKIMEDAKSETDMLFLKYNASLGMKVEDIDFERAGFLAGIYEEAERYLSLITAIEPLEKNKPHYSILDRLDKLDEFFINNNNIPGYYSIQKDSRIHKHKHEINNLDDYWNDYLSLKDKHKVTEGFGNLKYLLERYHSEFMWELIKIRPRDDIKEFLSYHFSKFKGEPIDFLNHIEFRIIPDIDGFARSDYPIYQLIMKEWLKDNRYNINQKESSYLTTTLISVVSTFLDNVFEYRKSSDENKYNILIRDFLNLSIRHKGWTVKDQSMGGTTDSQSKANSAGISSRDLIILNENGNHISAIECFRLKSIPKDIEIDSDIKLHLKKIFRNEPIGISPLFIIVYCETKGFSNTWAKYLDYISKIDFENYQNIECEKDFPTSPTMANLKVAKVKHIRETNEIEIYHIFINMNP